MIIPGLVTLATLYGSMMISSACIALPNTPDIKEFGEWAVAGISVTVMIMTQAIGILLEALLIRKQWLGQPVRRISIPAGVDPLGFVEFDLKPYEEYQGLYLLLAELREGEDSHGHLQRTLAQFFLSNNAIVSFTIGIIITLWRLAMLQPCDFNGSLAYLLLLLVCLVINIRVARIRFEVMAKALWAARRRRLEEAAKNAIKI
jgi:hypothetical protein